MRILLVEDDPKIATFILKGLKAEGFAVDHADDGEKGLDLALTEPYAAAIVDVMLPKLTGLELIKTVRREKVKTPVIVLSAKGAVEDRVKGLQTGADDYLAKPFAFSELLARVQALIRRSTDAAEPTRLESADAIRDLVQRRHHDDGYMRHSLIALQTPADLETVHAGHHDVEQHHVDLTVFADVDRFGAAIGNDHLEIFGEEAGLQKPGIGGHGCPGNTRMVAACPRTR